MNRKANWFIVYCLRKYSDPLKHLSLLWILLKPYISIMAFNNQSVYGNNRDSPSAFPTEITLRLYALKSSEYGDYSEIKITIWSSNFEYIPKNMKARTWTDICTPHVHSGIFNNSQKVEVAQVSHPQMDKTWNIYTIEQYLALKKEILIDIRHEWTLKILWHVK